MARGDAYNFPVVREAIGHADALYGFKGGFDRAGSTLGVKAGGYWPHNLERGLGGNHQSTVFLFDPDTGKAAACVGGNYLTAARTAAASAVSIKHLARQDAKVLGMVGAGHQSAFQMRAAARQRASSTSSAGTSIPRCSPASPTPPRSSASPSSPSTSTVSAPRPTSSSRSPPRSRRS